MNPLRSNALARASLGAIAAAAAIALAPVPAAAQTPIAGGGATLPSLVLRDLFNCYAVPPGGTFADSRPSGCSARVNPNVSFLYDSVGSGAGQRGWVSQNGGLWSATSNGRDVVFGVSEAALTSGNLGAYSNGGRYSSTGPTDIADQSDNCVSPATGNGADIAASGGCYDNPRVENGPAIQIPLLGVGVAVAFDPVYKTVRNADGTISSFRFQFTQRADNSGGLRLSRDTFCGIFAGTINRWNDAALTADNGGTPVWPDPADTAAVSGGDTRGRLITVVVRDDDSGTTALFTRALVAQCGDRGDFRFATRIPAGFSQTWPGNATPNSIPAGNFTTCDADSNLSTLNANGRQGSLLTARGSEGVATCLNTRNPTRAVGNTNVNGRIGYVSLDFVAPTARVAPYRGFALNSADLQNAAGNFAAPTIANVTTGLGSFTAPSGAARATQTNWVANPSGLVVGNPFADPAGATSYPIVGTTNMLLYTCYSNATKTESLVRTSSPVGFLNWLYSNNISATRIINNNGFVPLPAGLRTALLETFANPADPAGLNLFVRTAPVATGGFVAGQPGCTTGG